MTPRKRMGARGVGPRASRKSLRESGKVDTSGVKIYQEMLAEVGSSGPESCGDSRDAKRRKLEETSKKSTTRSPEPEQTTTPEDTLAVEENVLPEPIKAQQTVYDEFEGSDESDEEFEDIELRPAADNATDGRQAHDPEALEIDLSRSAEGGGQPLVQRRKQATSAEKKIRLDVHKWHVLCLLLHGHYRNKWCDSEEVQKALKPLIPRKLISLLHFNESKPQYQRNHSFNEAIKEICGIWRREWGITAKGIRRAFWKEETDVEAELDSAEDPVDQEDFRDAAQTRSGSRDLGAQLFCALLRSVAVDTRLVFSLQTLTFSGVAKGVVAEKPREKYIYASYLDRPSASNAVEDDERALLSNPRARLHETAPKKKSAAAPKRKPINDSPYPIFWVEVFNEAIQTWIPLDPLVRQTINKPKTGFEPPANDQLNSMSYVIAFEDDGSAKDVTRRYAQHYNARTRKTRVESTKGGERWWAKTMKFFEKPFPEDRIDIEDAELARREAQEAMPRNVQDFKGHPYYALERHLHKNEVIQPMREVGKVSVGSCKDAKLESVYRRRDVHLVRSAEQWYRHGRDVRLGEQPLKRVVAQTREAQVEKAEAVGTSLYADFQTELYVPPAVVNGRIPKNAFGNLDVYLPSMIPAGAVHLEHPDAAQAAKVLGIDYADAVTGFEFRGRQGTALVKGIVAATEYREALVEVLQGIQDERVRAEEEKRRVMALQMWKRFMLALKIKEQVNKEYADVGEQGTDDDTEEKSYTEDDGHQAGGGFFHEEGDQAAQLGSRAATPPLYREALPDAALLDKYSKIIIKESPHKFPQNPTPADDGFIAYKGGSDFGQEGGFLHGEAALEDDGGGFIVEEGQTTGSPNGQELLQSELIGQDQAVVTNAGSDTISPQRTEEQPAHPISRQSPFSYTPLDVAPEDIKSREKATIDPEVEDRGRLADLKTGGSAEEGAESDDNGSLLSHDPEDEDAEPDWLVGEE